MCISELSFLLLRRQHSGVFIVFLYSLTTVALTVQWSTQEPIDDNYSIHGSKVSTESHSHNMLSSSEPNHQESHQITKTPIVVQVPSSVQFLDTNSGKWFRWTFSYIIVPTIHLLSIGTNIINITVFIKVGIRDGASILFFGLSLSDMLYSCFYLCNRVLSILQYILNYHPYLRLAHLAFLMSPYSRMFFDISILITVFAGVQKCACVAIPLTFRNFFTFRKSVITLISIALCVLVYYMPRFGNYFMAPTFDMQFNRTRLLVKTSNRGLAVSMSKILKSVNRVSLPIVAEGILIFCVIVMTYKLRQAAVIRQAMTSAMGQGEKTSADRKDTSESGTESSLSKKELRVIRSVNIICLVFIAGTAPRCIIEACDLALKDFGDFSVHESLYMFMNSLQEVIVALSIAANIVVYFRFNTKYRETFQQAFGCFSGEKTSNRKI